MRQIFTAGLVALLFCAVTVLALLQFVDPRGSDGRTMNVTIGGEVFTLDLALDSKSRQTGLMNRPSIPDDGGMLFVFPRPEYQGFWMANCLIDMDIMFLDATGRITATHTMKAEPPQRPDESDADYETRMPRYFSRLPAQFAIELQAGTIKRLGVSTGDRIELDVARLKAMAR